MQPKSTARAALNGLHRGEGNAMNVAQPHGLRSDALGISTMREGCPQQPFRQLGASGLDLGDL